MIIDILESFFYQSERAEARIFVVSSEYSPIREPSDVAEVYPPINFFFKNGQ